MTLDLHRLRREAGRAEWYVWVTEQVRLVRSASELSSAQKREFVDDLRRSLADLIDADRLCLAISGPNLDDERQAITSAVIHHTARPSGAVERRMLHATHLVNVYASYYAAPSNPGLRHLRGQRLWSNHVGSDGQQLFYAYHWIVDHKGQAERLLADECIGWHAGSWKVNTSSVAICLDGDFRLEQPTTAAVSAVAALVAAQYPNVRPEAVRPHSGVTLSSTDCPGSNYARGWGTDLTRRLMHLQAARPAPVPPMT